MRKDRMKFLKEMAALPEKSIKELKYYSDDEILIEIEFRNEHGISRLVLLNEYTTEFLQNYLDYKDTTIQKEIDKLKEHWLRDPCWDLYETEGFEDYRDELKAFQEEMEQQWKATRIADEKAIDEEAENLGLKGIYRLVLEHKLLIERHNKAINVLADGDNLKAYRILNGLED